MSALTLSRRGLSSKSVSSAGLPVEEEASPVSLEESLRVDDLRRLLDLLPMVDCSIDLAIRGQHWEFAKQPSLKEGGFTYCCWLQR